MKTALHHLCATYSSCMPEMKASRVIPPLDQGGRSACKEVDLCNALQPKAKTREAKTKFSLSSTMIWTAQLLAFRGQRNL
jgi:hypothetical protein